MYVKLSDYNGQENVTVLMSAQEFIDGGNKLKNVPITITANGKEPIEIDQDEIQTEAIENIAEKTIEERISVLEEAVAEVLI